MYSIGCMVSEQLGHHHHGELSTLGMQVGMTNTEGRIVILHLHMYVCMYVFGSIYRVSIRCDKYNLADFTPHESMDMQFLIKKVL